MAFAFAQAAAQLIAELYYPDWIRGLGRRVCQAWCAIPTRFLVDKARRDAYTLPAVKYGAERGSGGVPEWLKGADCKSAGLAYVGSNPTPSTTLAPLFYGREQDCRVDLGSGCFGNGPGGRCVGPFARKRQATKTCGRRVGGVKVFLRV